MHKLYDAREQYLAEALEITAQETALIQEFEGWLPENIIDAHSHANLAEHVGNIPDEAYNHMLSTFPSFSIEESKMVQGLLHPTKHIRNLRFPKTFRGIDHVAANTYLLEQSPTEDRIALFGLPEDPAYTIDMLSDPRVSALKMYYSYLNPPAKTIYEIFKPEILAEAERLEVPIVLHAPQVITKSVDDVLRLCRDFPDLQIALAHLGSSKFNVPGLQDAYDVLSETTSIKMDTSLNPSADVCLRALTTFGTDRIMYGSDEPLHLIRSVPYNHPDKGQRLATTHEYHWQNPEDFARYKHLAEGAVHSHWLCLGALRTAIETFPATEQEAIKQQVFYSNAQAFYGFAAA